MTDRAILHGLSNNSQTVLSSDHILMRLRFRTDHLEHTYLTNYRSTGELLSSPEVNRLRERSFILSFYFLRST